MADRVICALYAADVERSAAFYARLGFAEHVRLPAPDGSAGYVGLRRGTAELGITAEAWPHQAFGRRAGPGPRFELMLYVDDLDAVLREPAGPLLRDAELMPWGERIAYLADPTATPSRSCRPTAASRGRPEA